MQGHAPAADAEAAEAAAPAPAADGTAAVEPVELTAEKKSKVYDFMSVIHDDVIAAGRHRGRRKITCICKVPSATGPGGFCGVEIQMTGSAPGKAPPTSNAIRHIKTKAEAGDVAHAEALGILNATSKNHVEINGTMVLVQSFEESFTHLVDFVGMVADGVPHNLAARESFRTYVRGFEERARFPHSQSVDRTIDVIAKLQRAAQLARIKNILAEFKGSPCIGMQLDMWTNSDTYTSYGAITISHVDERIVGREPTLWLVDELLAFNVFPSTTHSSDAIQAWVEHELAEAGLEHVNIADVTPDGAADGQAALNAIPGLAEKTNTCHLHGLQRALLFSVGLAGASSKNPAAKSLLRKHGRVTTLAVQSRQVAYGIREKQVAAGVPAGKILTLETGKNATRWAGQYKRLTRNCLLRPVIDPVVDQYKRDNRRGG